MKGLCVFALVLSSALFTHAQAVLNINGAVNGTPTLFVNNGAHINVSGGINVAQAGSPAGASNDYLQNNGTLQLTTDSGQGNFTTNVTGLKTFTGGQTTGNVIFSADTSTQFINGGGTVEFMNLTVNSGVNPELELNDNVTVDGVLNIGGLVNILNNNLTLLSSGSLAGSPFSSSNMVQADSTGQFVWGIKTGANAVLFPVGDRTPAYVPVNLNFASNSSAGTVGINVNPSVQPDMNNPGVATDYLKRYWTFTNTGLSTYTYTGNFNYLPGDVVGTEANIKLSRWANPWSSYGSSAAANTLTISSPISQTSGPLSGDFTGRNVDCSATTVSISTSDSVICASDSSRICASGSFLSYQWNNGDTGSCTYATAAGGYWVNVSASNGCAVTSRHINIGVYAVQSVSIIVQGDTLSSFGAAAYQWLLNGNPISGATSALYIAEASGEYSVQVSDTFGCVATSSEVSVDIVGAGVNNVTSGNSIQVYPNPFTSQIHCMANGTDNGIQKAEVYDLIGRVVFFQQYSNYAKSIEIGLTELPQGIYCLKISTPTAVLVEQVVKQ